MVLAGLGKPFVLLAVFLTLERFQQSRGEQISLDVPVINGSDLWLSCFFGDNQSIKWTENGSIINQTSHHISFFDNSSLQISNIEIETQFKCEVTLKSLTSNLDKKNVTFKIKIRDNIESITVEEGKNVSLTCPGDWENITWSNGKNTPNLTLIDVTRDYTSFKCNGTLSSNGSQAVAQQIVKLNVQYIADNVTVNLKPGSDRFNQILELTCVPNGNPAPRKFKWFRNGEVIKTYSGRILRKNTSSYSNSGGLYTCMPEPAKKNGSIFITIKVQSTAPSTPGPTEDGNTPRVILIVLGVITVVALVFAITCAILYLRQPCGCYVLNRNTGHAEPIQIETIEPPASPTRRERITSFSSIKIKLHICKSDPFSIKSFQNHVKRLHRDSDYLFSQEYEAVASKKYLSDADRKIELIQLEGRKAENELKNRFADIIPYDHSRVALTELDDDADSGYINASYVDSFRKQRAYIAAQGPLPNTVSDFWRMVWENNSYVIVMITNLFERSRCKCAKYWPDKGSQDYGLIRVTMVKEETFASYIVRSFTVHPIPDQTHYISLNGEHGCRTVVQFHFTEWPDHDVPAHAPSILRFINKSKAANPEESGPIVVHCSAGVGRSGTYIVIDSMMERVDDERTVDIFNFLNHIRTQRKYLVQEESQYIFVHDALIDYTHFGDSNIPIEKFSNHLNTLRKFSADSKTTSLKREFEAVDHTRIPEKHKWVGKKACNTLKNRRKDVLPVERTRVKLPPVLGIEGADYINASYIDGFSKKKEYIATQAPMNTTAEAFWRMVHVTKCNMIVMLLNEDEWKKDDHFSDLPTTEEAVTHGKIEIQLESEEVTEHVAIRKLRVFSSDLSDGRSVTHYHYRDWPENGFPQDNQSLIHFVGRIRDDKLTQPECAPVIVYCDFGVGRTGVFCLLGTIYDQLEEEGSIDVYNTAKLYRVQRPQFIETEEQYEFCYDILGQLVASKLSAVPPKLANGDKNTSASNTIKNQDPHTNKRPSRNDPPDATDRGTPPGHTTPDSKPETPDLRASSFESGSDTPLVTDVGNKEQINYVNNDLADTRGAITRDVTC